jgi:probable phosphoglycerate mutase
MIIDVSKSMGAEDYPPLSRLDKAREIILQMVPQLHGNRVALVTFAGNSFRQAELTEDFTALEYILKHWVHLDSAGMSGSALGRALETCRAAGFDGEVDADLQEWDYGDHEGRTTPEIREDDPGWTVWRGPVPGGESIDDVAARADRAVARIAGVQGDIAVFSHGHFLRVLAARWLGLAPTAGGMLLLDTGTISVLSTERESPAIRLWNGVPPPTT